MKNKKIILIVLTQLTLFSIWLLLFNWMNGTPYVYDGVINGIRIRIVPNPEWSRIQGLYGLYNMFYFPVQILLSFFCFVYFFGRLQKKNEITSPN